MSCVALPLWSTHMMEVFAMRTQIVCIAALAIMAATSAYAQPELTLDVFDNGVLVGTTSATDGTADLIISSDPAFSRITVGAAGVPILANGDLSSVSLAATATSITSPHTLTVDVFQTGIHGAAGLADSTFTVNNLVGTPGPTTETTYINGTESTLGTQVATHTFPEGTVADAVSIFSTPISAFHSDAQQYSILFNAPGESANDTMQFSAPVPEIKTWAMMLAGFAGLFLVARRREPRARFPLQPE